MNVAAQERLFATKRLCFEAHECIHKLLSEGAEGQPTPQQRRAHKAVVRDMRYLAAQEPETARWERRYRRSSK